MVSGITQPSMLQSQMGGLEVVVVGFVCFSFFLNEIFIAISVSLFWLEIETMETIWNLLKTSQQTNTFILVNVTLFLIFKRISGTEHRFWQY